MNTEKTGSERQMPPPGYGYYPMPYEAAGDEINLLDYWRVLVARKWLILAVTVLATGISVVTAMLMTPIYRAEVLLAPVDDGREGSSSALAQFGGLASMVGISLGGGGSAGQPLAVLKSRAFLEVFFKEENLLPKLFAQQWDEQKAAWKSDDAASVPTMWDAYAVFANGVMNISVDKSSGLITLSIEWKDPEMAAQWANHLSSRLNLHQRQGAIAEAEKSIAYLEDQLRKTSVVEMQQALYRLIEAETKKIMLANVREEYAFKVIDPAVVPEKKIKPKRSLIVILGFVSGLIVSVFLVFLLSFVERLGKENAGK